MNFRREPLRWKGETVGESESCSDAVRGDAVLANPGDDGTRLPGRWPGRLVKVKETRFVPAYPGAVPAGLPARWRYLCGCRPGRRACVGALARNLDDQDEYERAFAAGPPVA